MVCPSRVRTCFHLIIFNQSKSFNQSVLLIIFYPLHTPPPKRRRTHAEDRCRAYTILSRVPAPESCWRHRHHHRTLCRCRVDVHVELLCSHRTVVEFTHVGIILLVRLYTPPIDRSHVFPFQDVRSHVGIPDSRAIDEPSGRHSGRCCTAHNFISLHIHFHLHYTTTTL